MKFWEIVFEYVLNNNLSIINLERLSSAYLMKNWEFGCIAYNYLIHLEDEVNKLFDFDNIV